MSRLPGFEALDVLARAPTMFRLHLHGARSLDVAEAAAVWFTVLNTVPPDERDPSWWTISDAVTASVWRECGQSATRVFDVLSWARMVLHVESDGLGWIEACE